MELLVLKEPRYIQWLLGQQAAQGEMKRAQAEARRLIRLFDAKPFLKECFGSTPPAHLAERCSVYGNVVDAPYWWCNNCNPYQSGADAGKLQVISTYEGALNHVSFFCGNRSRDYKALIKELAEAKGLPKRVSKAQAATFFAEPA